MSATPLPTFAIPGIDTRRLTMRGHCLEDFADSAAMWGDPEITRHIGGVPFTPEEVWTKVLRYVGHWALLGFGYWVVREKASGRFVGEVGFADFKRVLEPGLGDAPENGWALASWAHGKGYATEAVEASLSWAATHLRASRTVCLIDPGNTASIHVAEKVGYREYARTSYKGAPTILFER